MNRSISIKIALTTLFTLLLTVVAAQSTVAIKGYVKDSKGHAVVGATVVVEEHPSIGAVSGTKGEYTIYIKDESIHLVASSLGYTTVRKNHKRDQVGEVNFSLEVESREIDAVQVSSRRWDDRVTSIQIGAEKVMLDEMAKTPALFGEKDVVKSMTLLPGVKAQGDGQSGIMVRGGSVTQNLMLLDNTPLHNCGHALGIFSVINGDALAQATLYKGLIPAQFGGAASSVFDLKSKSGDLRDYNFGFDVGLLSAKILAEGPIVDDRASFFIAARRSYFDLFLKMSEDYRDTKINFYDINANVLYQIDDNNSVSLSIFNGLDQLGLTSIFDMDWGNLNLSLGWFHRYSDRVTSNTTLFASGYGANTEITVGGRSLDMEGAVDIYGLMHEFIYNNDRHTLRMGAQGTLTNIVTADWTLDGFREREVRSGVECAAWVNDEWKISSQMTLSAGLRLNNFTSLGGTTPYYEMNDEGEIVGTLDYGKGESVSNYFDIEPRLSANYRLSETRSIKAGYARTSQNVYRVENNSMVIPFTRFMMSSNNLAPQRSNQVSMGYVNLTNDKVFEFSAEVYYKYTNNAYDYREGVSLTSEIEMESLIVGGKGRAYGLEFLARKNLGLLRGWVAYTLSWSQTKIDSINSGEWYDASNDMRHSLSVVGMCPLSERWSVAASWIYSTGRPLTAPSAKYELDNETVYYYNERNGYRTPAYHRLDVSFVNRKVNRNFTREWTLGVFNLYNQLNPFIVSFEDDAESATGNRTVQYSLYGLLPSVNYGIKF